MCQYFRKSSVVFAAAFIYKKSSPLRGAIGSHVMIPFAVFGQQHSRNDQCSGFGENKGVPDAVDVQHQRQHQLQLQKLQPSQQGKTLRR